MLSPVKSIVNEFLCVCIEGTRCKDSTLAIAFFVKVVMNSGDIKTHWV